MLCLILGLSVIGQVAETPAISAKSLVGTWSLEANGQNGKLIIALDKESQLKGEMYGQAIRGTFDPTTKKVVLKRLVAADGEEPKEVQVFTGTLEVTANSRPSRFKLFGTFEAVGGPSWGMPGVVYPWEADLFGSSADDIRQFQGNWVVVNAEGSSNARPLPAVTGLTEAGSSLTIRGNELVRDGRVWATLATDLSILGMDVEKDLMYSRRPLLLTLPDGRAILAAIKPIDRQTVEICYPHTMGRIASGYRVTLKRSVEK